MVVSQIIFTLSSPTQCLSQHYQQFTNNLTSNASDFVAGKSQNFGFYRLLGCPHHFFLHFVASLFMTFIAFFLVSQEFCRITGSFMFIQFFFVLLIYHTHAWIFIKTLIVGPKNIPDSLFCVSCRFPNQITTQLQLISRLHSQLGQQDKNNTRNYRRHSDFRLFEAFFACE